jgi:RNA polymerase sigma-70 factor (ECF subfamily)
VETEQRLLESIRSGEQGAQQRLYERFAGMAMATALRYVGSQDAARDVVQDSFVSILTTISRFGYRGEGSLKAWVLRIVAHQAIDHLKRHDRLLLTDHLPEAAAEEEPDVGRVPPDVLNRLIAQLPTGYRTVLNLYIFQQLSHREIGQLLGIKPETSASQYARAKQTLARLINNYIKNNKL